jgi:hypothetical protein
MSTDVKDKTDSRYTVRVIIPRKPLYIPDHLSHLRSSESLLKKYEQYPDGDVFREYLFPGKTFEGISPVLMAQLIWPHSDTTPDPSHVYSVRVEGFDPVCACMCFDALILTGTRTFNANWNNCLTSLDFLQRMLPVVQYYQMDKLGDRILESLKICFSNAASKGVTERVALVEKYLRIGDMSPGWDNNVIRLMAAEVVCINTRTCYQRNNAITSCTTTIEVGTLMKLCHSTVALVLAEVSVMCSHYEYGITLSGTYNRVEGGTAKK